MTTALSILSASPPLSAVASERTGMPGPCADLANSRLTVGGQGGDAAKIAPELLGDTVPRADVIEENTANGCHVVEFLPWGPVLNGMGLRVATASAAATAMPARRFSGRSER